MVIERKVSGELAIAWGRRKRRGLEEKKVRKKEKEFI